MFTPSLTSMMLHSFWADISSITDPLVVHDEQELADRLSAWVQQATYATWPQVPVVARTTNFQDAGQHFGSSVEIDEFGSGGGVMMWGRVPVNKLVEYYRTHFHLDESVEVFDLGTTLSTSPPAPTAGLPAAELAQCNTWLSRTNTTSPNVHICVIDQGDAATGTPEDFGGFLTHAETSNIQLSTHAVETLYALLDRLDYHGILPECRVYCSLVRPPAGAVGRKCFDHANATELVAAVRKTRRVINWADKPVLFNLSMGTHAGPHTGASPLEYYTARQADPAQGRYFFASASNDGLRGVSNRAFLETNTDDVLLLRTGPSRANELLLELWWRQPPKGELRFEVQVYQFDPLKKTFTSPFTSALEVNTRQAGAVLKSQANIYPNVVCKTLFHRKCYKDFSCAAFALSTNGKPGLPALDVRVTARSTLAPAVVNSWVVVADDPVTGFVCGNKSGSVTLPASDMAVVSVAGMNRAQPWPHSGRGPAAAYSTYAAGPLYAPQRAPWLAHEVDLGVLGAEGTSFASPRACADAANLVRIPANRVACGTVEDLVAKLVKAATPLNPADWNGRWGYGALS